MKIMTKALNRTTLGLALGLASSQLLAAGFALNEQSISGMGTGFAGRSSSADDASTVFGNPAGMSRIKREQISVGAAAVIAKTDIDNGRGTFGGSNDGDMVPVVGVPMGYYVKPIDDHWAFGLGVYVPFGLVTDYEKGFAGRYWGDKSHVQIVTFQPTVSYAFNDKVSIGFGPTINRIDGELTSATLNAATPGRNDGKVKIEGDDTAIGFNAGILVQATDTTRLGLTYHSKVDYKLKGKTKIEGSGFGPFGGQKYDASLDISTPESVDFSITQQLDENWTVYAGSTWTRWSRLQATMASLLCWAVLPAQSAPSPKNRTGTTPGRTPSVPRTRSIKSGPCAQVSPLISRRPTTSTAPHASRLAIARSSVSVQAGARPTT